MSSSIKLKYRKRNVVLIPNVERKLVAKEFKESVKEAFRAQATEKFKPRRKASHYKVHFVVPLRLGGDISFENLALVDEEIHKKIHRLIKKQTNDMQEGEMRTIDLPYKKGEVWELKHG
jgi:hypothetical protein